jgi:DNA helicase-2/ATP-dependent DNA helicase PcrA
LQCANPVALAQWCIAWAGQIGAVRAWYQSHLERLYDYATARAGDLDQLEQIARSHPSRERFLSELTLEPPDARGARQAAPVSTRII